MISRKEHIRTTGRCRRSYQEHSLYWGCTTLSCCTCRSTSCPRPSTSKFFKPNRLLEIKRNKSNKTTLLWNYRNRFYKIRKISISINWLKGCFWSSSWCIVFAKKSPSSWLSEGDSCFSIENRGAMVMLWRHWLISWKLLWFLLKSLQFTAYFLVGTN